MVLRERELAERKHDMELFARERQIDLEKIQEENSKPLIEAKTQEIDLMDSEIVNRCLARKRPTKKHWRMTT